MIEKRKIELGGGRAALGESGLALGAVIARAGPTDFRRPCPVHAGSPSPLTIFDLRNYPG